MSPAGTLARRSGRFLAAAAGLLVLAMLVSRALGYDLAGRLFVAISRLAPGWPWW